MATEGVTVEELCSFELFECSVCWESLINKQPRLLTCGHTFCTTCLQQLSTGNILSCPKCRSPTWIGPGGVEALAKNTDISKMKEREQKLSSRNEYYCQMCKRKDVKVEFFCTVCPKGQVCEACYNKHQRIPALKGHQIFPLEKKLPLDNYHENCKDHGELLEYFCTTCKVYMCVVCMCGPEHEEHCDDIVEFKTDLQGLKASMDQLHKELMDNVKNTEICTEAVKLDMDSLKEMKEELSVKCKDVETILNELKHQLNVLTELEHPLKTTYRELNTHLADVQKQIAEINDLNMSSNIEFIQRARVCRNDCNRIINDTQVILNKTIIIPGNIKQNIEIIGDVVQFKTNKIHLKEKLVEKSKPGVAISEKQEIKPGSEQVMGANLRQVDKNQNKEINNLDLMLEIKAGETVDIRNPLELVSVGDGTAILVDTGLGYLQRINAEGKVVRKYHVPLNERTYCKSASVYEEYLFVVTSDYVITKMSLNGSGRTINYEPKGIYINYLSVIEDSVMLISGVGQISEYNSETNQIIERVTDILEAGKVCVERAGADSKFIVPCGKIVHIFNKSWDQLSTIDLDYDVLTVTPSRKLLVVHENRVHEYSQDGRLIRELLDRYKFDVIEDITYDGRCLWMLEGEPPAIKIFKSNELKHK